MQLESYLLSHCGASSCYILVIHIWSRQCMLLISKKKHADFDNVPIPVLKMSEIWYFVLAFQKLGVHSGNTVKHTALWLSFF